MQWAGAGSIRLKNKITSWSGMSYSIERMPWGGLQIVVAEDVTGKMCSSLKIN